MGCEPGGDIMIHGLPNGFGSIGKLHAVHDWTLGCIAVTNEEIEEIWNLVPNGTLVVIRP
ncbi:MAG: L,D-transpeptidase [Terriglobia bacterium]